MCASPVRSQPDSCVSGVEAIVLPKDRRPYSLYSRVRVPAAAAAAAGGPRGPGAVEHATEPLGHAMGYHDLGIKVRADSLSTTTTVAHQTDDEQQQEERDEREHCDHDQSQLELGGEPRLRLDVGAGQARARRSGEATGLCKAISQVVFVSMHNQTSTKDAATVAE